MQYKMMDKPLMLLETVSMVHKYVNGLELKDIVPGRDSYNETWRHTQHCRAKKLLQLTAKICRDVDRNDPEMLRFFGTVECGCDYTCLALILTCSFVPCGLAYPNFWENVEAICKTWEEFQTKGYWIQSRSSVALIFSRDLDSPGDLLRQVKALNYPGDFRMELLDALMHFRQTVYRMAELIEPLSCRLEEAYREEPEVLGELRDFWNQKTQNEEDAASLVRLFGAEESRDVVGETWIAPTYMNSNILVAVGAENSLWELDHNVLLLGSLISTESITRQDSIELDSISAILKCLADRKRLEILHRLARERSYGLALAESIGMDPGHVSRNLGMMHNYGFVKQEREILRTYYHADRQTVHDFLMRVEEAIFS